MLLQRGFRGLQRQLLPATALGHLASRTRVGAPATRSADGRGWTALAGRWFTESRRRWAVKPVLLADIGEGIVECEVIQWFVEPGARVEEFSPLCEVQSDKASVEITSRFTGTVNRLHYEAGEMAKVGKPFVDIDIEADAPDMGLEEHKVVPPAAATPVVAAEVACSPSSREPAREPPRGKMATLATPAVRHLSRELKVDIGEIDGSGKDGRVLKEDIYKFVRRREAGSAPAWPSPLMPATATAPRLPSTSDATAAATPATETRAPLTQTQLAMFKTMTRSLAIPHFLYADEMDLTQLTDLRARLNRVLAQSGPDRLTYLPFIIKAMSMALEQFPLLNARVHVDVHGRPELVMRQQHNVGVAMDTPQGLLVPVIRDVAARSIVAIAGELGRLQRLATAGRLAPDDLAGGTISVSNIGNIGGTYVSPVIVEREVAILGVGRIRTRPAFAADDDDCIVRKQVCNLSWSADHRVVDGATMARASEVVRRLVEEPDMMVIHLR